MRVQYKNDGLKINKNAPFATPRRGDFTDLSNWYKQARKAIKDIPELSLEMVVNTQKRGHFLFHAGANENFVKFELHDHQGQRSYVIIDRKKPAIGG